MRTNCRAIVWGLTAMLVASALGSLLTRAEATTITQEVFARGNSSGVGGTPLDTGITLQSGDHLVITVPVNDTWDGGAACCGGPTNLNANGDTSDFFGVDPSTGFHFFSLIGKIDGGPFFFIGTSFDQIVTSSGTLLLAFDDTDSANNSGSVTATITTSAVPEPATLGLLACGLAGLAGVEWRRKRRV